MRKVWVMESVGCGEEGYGLVICMGALVRNMVCRELAWLGLGLGQQIRGFGAMRGATGAEGRVLAVAFKNRYTVLGPLGGLVS